MRQGSKTKGTIKAPATGTNDTGARIKKLLTRLERTHDMGKTEELERELGMLVDPEQHGFESIQDMFYSPEGRKKLGEIQSHGGPKNTSRPTTIIE